MPRVRARSAGSSYWDKNAAMVSSETGQLSEPIGHPRPSASSRSTSESSRSRAAPRSATRSASAACLNSSIRESASSCEA